MTQISIHLDVNTLKALEITAARNNTSISKWIEDRVQKELKIEWPENYFSLFGMLNEDDLLEPPEIPFIYEGTRESL